MEPPAIVDLTTLNEKQLGKEFKATAKAIKSKDAEVKAGGLSKLQNTRYYTEGGCFIPLVESTVAKKVICVSLIVQNAP
jgi:hypothetical protein